MFWRAIGDERPPTPDVLVGWSLPSRQPSSTYDRWVSTSLAAGWEVKFNLACATLSGEQYQELFAQVMERRDPGFRRVRPWGTLGDRKNDGWSPARRMLFQCYAPSTMSERVLVAKLVEDYEGAADYWADFFDKWIFVHNDRGGMAPTVSAQIAVLNARSDDIACDSWGPFQLRGEFACLTDNDRSVLLGPALVPLDFMSVDAQVLRPLIDALGAMTPDPGAQVAPVPATKIAANELNDAQIFFLQMGAARAPLVEQYLTNAYMLPSHADEIAEAVAVKYRQLRDDGHPPSVTLDFLIAWVTGGSLDSTVLAHGFAVIAYFFERCHIFEIPGDDQ